MRYLVAVDHDRKRKRGDEPCRDMPQKSLARGFVIDGEPALVRPIRDVGDDLSRPFAVQRTIPERHHPVGFLFIETEHDFPAPAHPAERKRELVAVRPLPRAHRLRNAVFYAGFCERALQIEAFDLLLHGVGEMLEIAAAAAAEMTAHGFYPVV